MSGIELLREVIKLHPVSRRVLLTAYADTEVAIAGINDIALDHYLMKPWDPPEQRLYPVLDDLLGEWRARAIPSFDGIRVLGSQWSNLIDNALDAVGVDGRVVVTAAEEMGRVVVRITDNGPGIPTDIQARIFEPFFTTKGVGQGTGLGLDIVRRLLHRHEGEIAVESAPGRTEFQVRLPVAASRLSPRP